MTMALVSTAPVVRAALIAQLSLRAGLADVSVTHVWPGGAAPQEAIYLGRTTLRNAWATMRAGRKTREEDYRIELFVWVLDPTDWGAASEARAFELMAEVENMVADDPTLGLGMPTLRMIVSDAEATSGPSDTSGWGTVIRVELQIFNRLT